MIFSFLIKRLKFFKKVNKKENSKKISDYIKVINDTCNLRVINDSIFNSIKRYDLSFKDIRLSHNIDLYHIKNGPKNFIRGSRSFDNKCVFSIELFGITREVEYIQKVYPYNGSFDSDYFVTNYYEKYKIKKRYIPDYIDLSESNLTEGILMWRTVCTKYSNIVDIIEVDHIDYGDYTIFFYYNSDDPEDLVMEAVNLLNKYGFVFVEKSESNMGHGNCNKLIVFRKKILC